MIFGFFKKKGDRQVEAVTTKAPGTDIAYDPELVDSLKGDHQALLVIFNNITAAFKKENYTKVAGELKEFRTLLQSHLLTENVRFYIYLQRQLAGSHLDTELILGFRKEMDGIGRAVIRFLDKYESIDTDTALTASFEGELTQIGQVLGERIKKEEEVLYPLYRAEY